MRHPRIITPLPGPRAEALIALDSRYVSLVHPGLSSRGRKSRGTWVTDPDGNEFLDFTSGIAVCATGHCHPRVVEAIKDQADRLLHMSGTDFYYTPQIILAEKLASLVPGGRSSQGLFRQLGGRGCGGGFKLARWHTRREWNTPFSARSTGAPWARSPSRPARPYRKEYSPFVPGITHIPYLTATAVPRGCAILDATWPACDGSKTPFSVPPFLPTKLQPSLSNPYRGRGIHRASSRIPPRTAAPRRQLRDLLL